MGNIRGRKAKPIVKRFGRRNRQAIVIDGDLRRMIRQEARNLNMSEEEYLRLAVHFSEAIRSAALPAGLLDGGFLTSILGNPMIMNMIKGMIGNAITKYFNKDEAPSNAPASGGGGGASSAPGMGMPPGANYGRPQPQMGHGMPRPGYGGPMPGPQGGRPPGMPGPPGPPGMRPMGPAGPGMYGMPGMPQQPANKPAEDSGNNFSMDGIAKMMMNMLGNQK